MKVKDNQLHFDMKDYKNKLDGKSDDTVIKDFEIPNHSLVSVNSKQKMLTYKQHVCLQIR